MITVMEMGNWKTLIVLVAAVVTLAVGGQDVDVMLESKFDTGPVLCDAMERVERGCSVVIPYTRSLVECVLQCGSDTSCIGASLDPDCRCFLHKECSIISGCTTEFKQHQHMIKHCAHGVWHTSYNSCQCVDGTFGERCDQFVSKCRGLASKGYIEIRQRAYIDPDHDGTKPILVMCFNSRVQDNSAVQILRNSGEANFNKSWTEYVNEFFYDMNGLWGGLYPLYRLTNAGYNTLSILLKFLSRAGTPRVRLYYNGIRVSGDNENKLYSFTFSHSEKPTINGDIPAGTSDGDCLGSLQGVPFSTWDANNDANSDENCAANAGSGWWYNGCDNPCNVLGYGLQYLDSKPRSQVFSFLEVDCEAIATEQVFTQMSLGEP